MLIPYFKEINLQIIPEHSTNPPSLDLTESAFQQLDLMIKNDFTIEGKFFRVQITGKKCEGFTYSAGFTPPQDKDIFFEVNGIQMVVDPFTAFYLQRGVIDYLQNFELEMEGFIVENLDQKNFEGKFWLKNPEKIPPAL